MRIDARARFFARGRRRIVQSEERWSADGWRRLGRAWPGDGRVHRGGRGDALRLRCPGGFGRALRLSYRRLRLKQRRSAHSTETVITRIFVATTWAAQKVLLVTYSLRYLADSMQYAAGKYLQHQDWGTVLFLSRGNFSERAGVIQFASVEWPRVLLS